MNLHKCIPFLLEKKTRLCTCICDIGGRSTVKAISFKARFTLTAICSYFIYTQCVLIATVDSVLALVNVHTSGPRTVQRMESVREINIALLGITRIRIELENKIVETYYPRLHSHLKVIPSRTHVLFATHLNCPSLQGSSVSSTR